MGGMTARLSAALGFFKLSLALDEKARPGTVAGHNAAQASN